MLQASISHVDRFVDALARRDFESVQAVFAPDVHFRALIPPGVRDAATAVEARGFIEGWFSDATEFELVNRSVAAIGDRVQAIYRIHLREDGTAYVCEQHVFANVGSRGIEKLDLMCSRFHPRDAMT